MSLYGKGSHRSYEEKLRIKLSQHPKVILLGPLPAEGFLALLAKASVYLRPSTIDSYGLVITDAINVGTPCLASDVCARDPRCEIFPVGDKDAFMRQATDLVEQGRNLRTRKTINWPDPSRLEVILKCYR